MIPSSYSIERGFETRRRRPNPIFNEHLDHNETLGRTILTGEQRYFPWGAIFLRWRRAARFFLCHFGCILIGTVCSIFIAALNALVV